MLKTHEQNGMAERRNIMLMNMVQGIFSKSLFAESLLFCFLKPNLIVNAHWMPKYSICCVLGLHMSMDMDF